MTLDASGYLSYDYAQTLYLSKNDCHLTYITGITPGAAVSGSVLVLDDTDSIATIISLIANNIYGSIKTTAQTSITSVGTLSALTIGGNLVFTGGAHSITGLTSITATNIIGTLQSGGQTNITSVGTLNSLDMNMAGFGIDKPSKKSAGRALIIGIIQILLLVGLRHLKH